MVKKEVLKLLDVGVIYTIADSKWVRPTQVVPKKSGVTLVVNENNELIPTHVTFGWRVCIDYRKLNAGTRKDHLPLPFVYGQGLLSAGRNGAQGILGTTFSKPKRQNRGKDVPRPETRRGTQTPSQISGTTKSSPEQ